MKPKVISISLPENMLKRIDAAAKNEYQTRSNFIRMCIVEKFGAKDQYQMSITPPKQRTTQEIWDAYDFEEEYEQMMAEIENEKEDP